MPDKPTEPPTAKRTRRLNRILSGEGALALLCAFLIALSVSLWIENRNLRANQNTAPAQPLEAESAGRVYAFLIPPGALRSEARARQVMIPESISIVQIDLALDRLWPGGNYNVTLSLDGEVLWSQSGSAPQGATKVSVLAPRSILAKGRYNVALAAPQGDAGPDALNYYYFVVR